jgi:hypothetical protein
MQHAAMVEGAVYVPDWLNVLPHGLCLLWDPLLVWLTVLGHATTALSYYAIPVVLVFVALRRPDLPFARMYWGFGTFILLCGTTHVVAIVTIWWPVYWLAAWVGLMTGAVSTAVAVILVRTVRPVLAALPGGPELSQLRGRIEQEARRLDEETARVGVEMPLPPEALALTRDLLQDIDTMIARAERLMT